MSNSIGVVIIGRNEGQRLIRCFDSVICCAGQTVYVDSGSTDGSVTAAKQRGIDVIELNMSEPFTAARARNAGFRHLCQVVPGVFAVQFVDGDCEVVPGWIARAADVLTSQPLVGMVCGRLRERHREATIYNCLCDMEWQRPSGSVDSCGGIVMVRRKSLDRVGGYNQSLIAGEDPELCVRIRALGEEIWRLPEDMATHDAAMTRFGQWYKRCRRTGWAYAAGAVLHGKISGGHNVRSVIRAVFWGIALPLIGATLMIISVWKPIVLVGLIPICLLYFVVVLRLFRWSKAIGHASSDALLYAIFCTIAKPAEAIGIMEYWAQDLRGRRPRLIEYKDNNGSKNEPAASASKLNPSDCPGLHDR